MPSSCWEDSESGHLPHPSSYMEVGVEYGESASRVETGEQDETAS